jgi:hypothetical protein
VIDLGLTSEERRQYELALRSSHQVYIAVWLLDGNEDAIASLTQPASMVLSGQVLIDASAEITRSLQLEVLDPRHRLFLSPSSPRATAIYPGKMIRVVRYDYVAGMGSYVACPVFWGPITRFEREGHIARIQAVGKESLNLVPRVMWESFTIKKGRKVVSAIRDVLTKAGEQRFSFPDPGRRALPKRLAVLRHDEGWKIAKRLARSINRELFYDGRGKARLRSKLTKPIFRFYDVELKGKPKPTVLNEPRLVHEFYAEMRNTIEVLGARPSGSERRVRYVARLRASDGLSAESLRFNGEPGYAVETIENDKIKRTSQAKALATSTLARTGVIGTEIQFDALPQPHLEENDLVALVLEDRTVSFRLKQFTIPLTDDGVMNVGSLRRTRMPRRPR